MTSFTTSTKTTISWFKNQLECFDLTIRSASVGDQHFILIFVGGVNNTVSIQPILEALAIQKDEKKFVFYPATVIGVATLEEAMPKVLHGQTLVIKEGTTSAWIIDTRSIPGRNPSEPQVEQSIRGARDGFVELLIVNIGLIRKRIKDPNLVTIARQYGKRTHTDMAVLYIKDLVDQKTLTDLNTRLDKIDVDKDIHSERHLTELLYGQSFNPYPHVRYTERPDIVAIHLLQGHISVIVDQSPTAVLLPATFLETTSQIEEYTQTYMISIVLRFLRLLGVLASLYLLPIWMIFVINSQRLFFMPEMRVDNPYLFGFQILIVDCLIEWIRLSLIHSPSILSSMLGLIAVFVLGESAIQYGAYTQEILIVVAIVNIGNFVTSSYELSMANKISRIFFVLCTAVFQTLGFVLAVIVHFVVLATSKSGSRGYLYPIVPFNFKELMRILIGDYNKNTK